MLQVTNPLFQNECFVFARTSAGFLGMPSVDVRGGHIGQPMTLCFCILKRAEIGCLKELELKNLN